MKSFLEELPKGLDTLIGERGARISGGQRQRIAIARALYHEPSILIFDEATSALDNKTERKLINTINGLMKDRTVIIVTHRLTTVYNHDRVYFMREGCIADHGTFEELILRNSEFSAMAQHQVE